MDETKCNVWIRFKLKCFCPFLFITEISLIIMSLWGTTLVLLNIASTFTLNQQVKLSFLVNADICIWKHDDEEHVIVISGAIH